MPWELATPTISEMEQYVYVIWTAKMYGMLVLYILDIHVSDMMKSVLFSDYT